jgi:hypothetical protein
MPLEQQFTSSQKIEAPEREKGLTLRALSGTFQQLSNLFWWGQLALERGI